MRSVTISICLIAVFVSIASYKVYAQSNQAKVSKIAILQISSLNVPEYYSESIRNNLEYYLTDSGKFDILERQVIQKVLNEKKFQNRKMSKVAKMLSADYLVTGSIELIENYTLRIKVISGETGKILFVYSQQYKKKNDYSSIVNHLGKKITADIQNYTNTKLVKKYNSPDIRLGLSFNFSYPIGSFRQIVDYGVGSSLRGFFDINNYMILLELGYYSYSPSVDRLNEFVTVPLLFGVGYKINYTFKIFCIPYLSPGINYFIYKKEENTENKNFKEIEFTMKAGIVWGFHIADELSLMVDLSYFHIFEQDDAINGINSSIGFIFKL